MNKFTKYVTKELHGPIIDITNLLSYASYLSDEVFNDPDCKTILKDFISSRTEFKELVQDYLNEKKINYNRLIELGGQLQIIFYYEDPQEHVAMDKRYVDEKGVAWILDYYKSYLEDVKSEKLSKPNYVGEIGTVGYYGGYIRDLDKLDQELKEGYLNSLTELERKTLGF